MKGLPSQPGRPQIKGAFCQVDARGRPGFPVKFDATSRKHARAIILRVRPRSDKRGFDLISDALPFGLLWYREPGAISNAIGYAKFFSRSHNAVIRVYD